jgi:hypothetical protein
MLLVEGDLRIVQASLLGNVGHLEATRLESCDLVKDWSPVTRHDHYFQLSLPTVVETHCKNKM